MAPNRLGAKKRNKGPVVRKFAHSILICLDLLFRNKLIHCDLKPENVLLKQQGRSGLKVRSVIMECTPETEGCNGLKVGGSITMKCTSKTAEAQWAKGKICNHGM